MQILQTSTCASHTISSTVEKINESDDDNRIICVIADVTVAWAFDVAEKMGIQSATFWPNVPATLALILLIPKLIEDGIIDTQGNNYPVFLTPPSLSISLEMKKVHFTVEILF